MSVAADAAKLFDDHDEQAQEAQRQKEQAAATIGTAGDASDWASLQLRVVQTFTHHFHAIATIGITTTITIAAACSDCVLACLAHVLPCSTGGVPLSVALAAASRSNRRGLGCTFQ